MTAFRLITILFSLAGALFVATWSAQAVAPPPYRIICNPSNSITAVDRRLVQDAFLKRVTIWPTGELIRPVDQVSTSPVRRTFSQEVLKRPVEAVRSYWQQRIFAGRELPPPEVRSDDEVVRFVLREPGAVGYVSGDAPVNGAKILIVN
jgi:hypothetical protein